MNLGPAKGAKLREGLRARNNQAFHKEEDGVVPLSPYRRQLHFLEDPS